MDSEVAIYIVPLLSSQPDGLKETAARHTGKITELVEASGVKGAPSPIFILSQSGSIEILSVPQKRGSEDELGKVFKFALLFCEGDFEVTPPNRHFIEQFRFIFRILSVVYPLSQATIRTIVHQGESEWSIADVGVHPLYLIEHIHRLCAESMTYRASLTSEGWYSASFQEVRTQVFTDGKFRITGWVQNVGVHTWRCGSALGAVRLGLLASDEGESSFELRFDFERSTVFPGEGSYFEFELQKPYEWIEIDCVVESEFWFGKSNQNSQILKITGGRDESLFESIANKGVLLKCHTNPSDSVMQNITRLQRECKKYGIELQIDIETPCRRTNYDFLYVDFDNVLPSAENILALRRSAYEFSDIRATSPLFRDVTLGSILYGCKKTSSHFEHLLWSRSLGALRRRAVDGVAVGCVYVRDLSTEHINAIKELTLEAILSETPILVCPSIILELSERDKNTMRFNHRSCLGE